MNKRIDMTVSLRKSTLKCLCQEKNVPFSRCTESQQRHCFVIFVAALLLTPIFFEPCEGSSSNRSGERTSPRSSGTLLSELQKKDQPVHINRITSTPSRPRPTNRPAASPLTSFFGNSPFDNLPFSYFSGATASDNINSLRTFLFPPMLTDDQTSKGIRLAGSFLHYMGRVQVAMLGNQWGSICGEGWDLRDATVACRQLGFNVGGVIARPRTEFGRPLGPTVMSRVRCRGHESSLSECPAERWDGENSLTCRSQLSAAGIVCGCSMDIEPKVRSRCFLFTSFPYDTLYCRHSCASNQVLLGDDRRHCGREQTWSGISPQCIEISPDVPRPICMIEPANRIPCLRQNTEDGAVLRSLSSRPSVAEECISLGCCYDDRAEIQAERCYLPGDSPCTRNPCMNGGTCRDYFRKSDAYDCECPAPYAGKNCEFLKDWTCGLPSINPDLSNVRHHVRIFGGNGARKGSWPWIVQFRNNSSLYCSGTLISSQWVLTAAHCLKMTSLQNGPNNSSGWTIVVGQHRLTGFDSTSQRFKITYAARNNYTYVQDHIPRRDIALLKLEKPVTLNDHVSPICLPTFKNENPLPGTKCWIAGWGKTLNSAGSEVDPLSLQQGVIPILSTAQCRLYDDPVRYYRLVEENMICAGYDKGGVDACEGDSGGPLMCSRDDGSWYLAGIVSWGYGCAAPRTPGVYTRVSHYLGWIYETIKLNL